MEDQCILTSAFIMGIILALTKIDYNDKDIIIHGRYRWTYFSYFKFYTKLKKIKEIEDI